MKIIACLFGNSNDIANILHICLHTHPISIFDYLYQFNIFTFAYGGYFHSFQIFIVLHFCYFPHNIRTYIYLNYLNLNIKGKVGYIFSVSFL